MSSWSFVVSAGEGDTELVRAVSPLAVDLLLECGPVRVPIGVSATAEAGLESPDGWPARVLRSFLQNNPWEGMGSVTSKRWMLLARGEETMVFGQRHGQVGLGSVVTMSRRDIHGQLRPDFRPAQMSGPRPVLPDDEPDDEQDGGQDDGHGRRPVRREQPEPVFRAWIESSSSRTVRVAWTGEQNASYVRYRLHARTELLETPEAVHFLLITSPNPEFRPPPPGYAEIGTGHSAEAAIELSAPLGDRGLFSDYGAPSTEVLVHRGAAR